VEQPPSPKKTRQKPGPKGPSKFSSQRAAAFLREVRKGVSKTHAAAIAGCSRESIRLWAEQGRKDTEAGLTNAYTRFFGDMSRALAHTFAPHEVAVQAFTEFQPWWVKGKARKVSEADMRQGQLMRDQARHALAVLRVRSPRHWGGPAVRMEHSGPGGLPLASEPEHRVDLSRLSATEYARYAQLAEVAREDFASMAPELVAEFQALLKKARGA
jgi:hypothetical protein